MKDIRVTAVQMTSAAGNYDRNLERMEGFVSKNRDSDIVCFPEMCLSGYSTQCAEVIALSEDDPVVRSAERLSEEYGPAVVFGFIEKRKDGMYLRQEVSDDGSAGVYRKTHLGIRESALFKEGDAIPVFDVHGVRTGMHLCTESHIPDIAATQRAQGAELVLIPFANGISGDRRRDVWHSYLPARACDNGMFVIGCSAVGDNGKGTVFGGGLIALDPKGFVMTEYYGDDEHYITVEIGGRLPREGPETMQNISYFDRRRYELYMD